MRESFSLRLPKVYFSVFADIAKAFTINEEPSLTILKKYNASYVLVFVPDELDKFYWIAQIAGYDSIDYLTYNNETKKHVPTPRGEEVTLLRLILDDVLQPRHFTKLYETDKAKIYRSNYYQKKRGWERNKFSPNRVYACVLT